MMSHVRSDVGLETTELAAVQDALHSTTTRLISSCQQQKIAIIIIIIIITTIIINKSIY